MTFARASANEVGNEGRPGDHKVDGRHTGGRLEPNEGAGQIFLPFEGDRVFSIILSKAFLLADDTRIKDPTIVQQIAAR